MSRDILFKSEDWVFSFRAAGILIRDGRILLQKPKGDDYALIGGHVSAFETASKTLKREYKEEIHADIEVGEMIAVGEIFFPWGERPCHQIGLYYRVELKDPDQIPLSGVFHGYDEWDNERIDLDFCWVPVEELGSLTVYPTELIPHILSGKKEILHFVSRQIQEEA